MEHSLARSFVKPPERRRGGAPCGAPPAPRPFDLATRRRRLSSPKKIKKLAFETFLPPRNAFRRSTLPAPGLFTVRESRRSWRTANARFRTRRGVFFEVTRAGGRAARHTRTRLGTRERRTRGGGHSGRRAERSRSRSVRGGERTARASLASHPWSAFSQRVVARARISRKLRCSGHHRDHGVRDRGQVRRALRPSFPRPRRFSRLRALRR